MQRYRRAWAIIFAPLADLLVVSIILLATGQFDRMAGLAGDLFVARFGTAHQRLGWKAENFFTDAKVIALCKAVEAKDIREIDRLAKAGANVNAKGRGNMTPLLWAFPMGEETFGKMLDLGADPNVQLTENRIASWDLWAGKGQVGDVGVSGVDRRLLL